MYGDRRVVPIKSLLEFIKKENGNAHSSTNLADKKRISLE